MTVYIYMDHLCLIVKFKCDEYVKINKSIKKGGYCCSTVFSFT